MISNTTSGYITKKMKSVSQRDISIPMLTAALFTRYENNLSIQCWVNREIVICNIPFQATLKQKILPNAAAWMNPDNTVLSDISQKKKEKTTWSLLC